jgi:hypothetical protein
MYRHELRFLLRFGVREQFNELARRLYNEETARGWTPLRIWRATSGHVNQMVIEHDYPSLDAFRSQKAAFHEDPGSVGEVLGSLSELAVPGTATEFEFDGVKLAGVEPARAAE